MYSLVDDDDEATKNLYAEFADDTKNMKKSVDSVSVENRKLKVKLIYVYHNLKLRTSFNLEGIENIIPYFNRKKC